MIPESYPTCIIDRVSGEKYISLSIIEDIKAEIQSCRRKFYRNDDNTYSPYMEGTLNEVIKIIDKHISRKEEG